MVNFEVYSGIVFVIVLSILLYFNRKKFKLQKIWFPFVYILLCRTKIGIKFIKMRGFTMPSGKLKWFNAKKGYGFITDDETQKDIFLHVSALEDSKLRVLKEEQTIVYDIKEEKDKLQAINIKKK